MTEGKSNPTDWSSALGAFIATEAGARRVRLENWRRLIGGAIRENWAVTVTIAGGPLDGTHELVLRTDARSTIAESRPLGHEFALLKAAHGAGVAVPEPFWHGADASVIGKPFYLMGRLAGVALGNRIVRDGANEALCERLAAELAKIHAITPPRRDLDFLEHPRNGPALDAVAKYRAHLDGEPEPHPALEWGLRWLDTQAPAAGEIVLAHRDFRTGNYLVDGGRLSGIVDWEFAGWSDPMEDIGWFCARCWRFGAADREAGGIARRETFYRAYETASGRAIDRETVPYWEAMAHVRWAIIGLQQTGRHRSGNEPSLELALIGRRMAELEHEILGLTGVA